MVKSSSTSSSSSNSVIEKLKQLRDFVGCGSSYTESDLSTCLRESHFNVNVAAERLMTGMFQPPVKKQKTVITPSKHNRHHHHHHVSSSSSSSIKNDPQQHQLKDDERKMPPSNTATSTIATATAKAYPVTPKTPLKSQSQTSSSSSSSSHRLLDSNTKNSSSWLLCERWISDGISVSRKGSCDYKERLNIPEPSPQSQSQLHPSPTASSTTTATSSGSKVGDCPMLRFRSSSDKLQGAFPRELSQVLSPLFHNGYIHLRAYALMEQRHLVTGSHVAFSLSVWIVDPPSFFRIFNNEEIDNDHDDGGVAVSNSKQFFDNSKNKKKNTGRTPTTSKKRTLVDCAFQLLQWAQNGTPLEELIELTSTTSTTTTDDEEDDDRIEEEDVDGMTCTDDATTTETGEEKAVPDWAHTLVEENEEPPSNSAAATAATSNIKRNNNKTWDEMETPDGMKVDLRPYQKQALLWMTEREQDPDFNNESAVDESSSTSERLTAWKVEQIQLLKELAQSGEESSSSLSGDHNRQTELYRQLPPTQNEYPIVCECGPVRIDTDRVDAPAVSEMKEDRTTTNVSSQNLLVHPLWERRYLTNESMEKAYSFFVQPFLGEARGSPPPPPVPCRGGIVADEMGLGKTVMLLALVQNSKNKDSLDAVKHKLHNDSTLIVTPLSLLYQWKEEIETKTSLSCKEYYGDTKKNSFSFANKKTDIVLTTYGTLQAEYCKRKETGPGQTNWLLSQNWKRLILDECHQTKNHTTVVSRACCLVSAERRWCVSGTIIQNSLDDVYALMRILKHEPWNEYGFWKAAVSALSDVNVALDRVKRLLRPIMIRRTKDSLGSDGKPILTLPDIDYEAIKIDFSTAERLFYEALYKKSFDIFHGFIEAGTASSSWLKIFSLLHRLRQTCSHVALTVKSHVNDDEWAAQIAGQTHNVEQERDSNNSTSGSIEQSFLEDLQRRFRLMQEDSSDTERGYPDGDDSVYALKIANMLDNAIRNDDSNLKEECSICLENLPLHDSVVTPCLHLFCRSCLQSTIETANSSEKTVATCPVCQKDFDRLKILCLSSDQSGRFTTNFLHDSKKRSSITGRSTGSIALQGREGEARNTLQVAMQGSQSSKLRKIKEELDKIWNVEPGSRVLVYSQFLGFLDIMEQTLTDAGIQTWRLDGKLSLKERIGVLKEFGSNNESVECDNEDATRNTGSTVARPKKGPVLLISMKAGGQGLNLVSARSVFIVDPWWNAAVEDQCINRIHRIGQTAKRVFVRKFYVADSIEERIMELQRRKKNIASAALSDIDKMDAASSNRPSLDDFKLLFQESGESDGDGDGNMKRLSKSKND
mmetsp:Transcript_59417/g.145401  ORF Transcript_59417/g.145401 Transcript_59417/m.145401 type:complete len:1326 (-) Transcript_59417:1146-5123(-)